MGKLSVSDIDNYKTLCDIGIFRPNVADCKAILNHIDAIEAEKDRLIESVAQLQQQLYNAALEMENKKVVLPKEVAEAIETLKVQDRRWGISTSSFDVLDLVNGALRGGKQHKLIEVIASWINDDFSRKDVIVQALVNGYTVEEPTTEDKIFNEIKHNIVKEQLSIPDYIVSRIAHDSVESIREILAEDRQHD